MPNNISPASYAIKILGGVNATARIVRRSPSSVSRWLKPRRKNTKGGVIPTKAMRIIFDYARMKKLDISLLDLVYGRKK